MKPAPPFPALVLAGGTTLPDDPLYELIPNRPKALLQLGGRTLVEAVVAALQPPLIGPITLVGLPPEDAPDFGRPVSHLPDHGHLVDNVRQALAWQEQQTGPGLVLLVTADIPAISADDVAHFIDLCRPFDATLWYPFLSRETIEARFPGAKRTWSHFRKDGQLTGGNIFLVHTRMMHQNPAFWHALVAARKSPLRTARLVGFGTLLRLALRRLSLADVELVATRKLGVSARIVRPERASLGMDIDKPDHYHQLAAALGGTPDGAAERSLPA
jgi:CTP:molybdopterin cytidylyltransferase MocA